jgi:lysophospholipase L1-like esterase
MHLTKARQLLSVIVLSFLLAGCGITQLSLLSTLPTLIVLGDSVSAGQHLPDTSDAYPSLLASDLHAQLTVYAVPGHTTAQTFSMYTGELAPSYAVIELGTNDYNDSIPLATFAANYHRVVASIAPATRLACLSLWDPRNLADAGWSSSLGIPSPVNRVGVAPAAYNAIIERLCRGVYLSLQSIYDTPAYHGSGSPGALYHPSAAGDAAIARLVYGALQAIT